MTVSKLLQPVEGTQLKNSHFNSIPEFCCARKAYGEREATIQLRKLGEVFLKYRMQEEFALFLNHRHFPLTEGEVLVETVNNDGTLSVTIPWKISEDGEEVEPTPNAYWEKHCLSPGSLVVPQTWRFSDDGEVMPYEYISSSSALTPPPTAFVKELYHSLSAMGLGHLFGLKRLGDIRTMKTFEITPSKEERTSLTGFGKVPEGDWDLEGKEFKVLWYFKDNGDPVHSCSCNKCGTCDNC